MTLLYMYKMTYGHSFKPQVNNRADYIPTVACILV